MTRRAQANAALLPTVQQLVAMYHDGHRGKRWREAFARLETTAALLTTKGTTDETTA
jgi:hypothetical protein